MNGFGVKEYEETLVTYKQENFDLKVRIYMLEEKIEQLYKKYAHLKDLNDGNADRKLTEENMVLQKKLKENCELLAHALDALNALDTKAPTIQNIQKENSESENLKCTELFIKPTNTSSSLSPTVNDGSIENTVVVKEKPTISEVISQENVLLMEYKNEIKSLKKRLDGLQDELAIEKNRNTELKKIYDSYTDFKTQLTKLSLDNEEKEKLVVEKDDLIRDLQRQLERYEQKEFIENHKEYKRICDLLKENTSALDEKVQTIIDLTTSIESLKSEVKSFEEIISKKDKDLEVLKGKYAEVLKQAELSQTKLEILSGDYRKTYIALDEYKRKINLQNSKGERSESTPTSPIETDRSKIPCGALHENVQIIIKENENLREFYTREVETREMKIRLLEMENSRALDLIRDFLIYESQTGEEKKNVKKRSLNTKWIFLLQQKEQQISQLEHELTNLLKSVRSGSRAAAAEQPRKERIASPVRSLSPTSVLRRTTPI